MRRRPTESLQQLELDPADDARPIEAVLSSAQESVRLVDAVRRLPLIQREVVVLALEDMDYAEIAAVLGITEINVGRAPEPGSRQLAEIDGRTRMNALQDLDQMKQQWLAQSAAGPDVAALRERVAADNRSHRRTLVLVGLATLLIIALTFGYAWRSARCCCMVQLCVHDGVCRAGMAGGAVAVARHLAATR